MLVAVAIATPSRPAPVPPVPRLRSDTLIPPLEPGARVVTMERSGRPVAAEPDSSIFAFEPSRATASRVARSENSSRKARIPRDGLGCSTAAGLASLDGALCSATTASEDSTGFVGASGSVTARGTSIGGGKGRSSRIRRVKRSCSSSTSQRSGIGRSISGKIAPMNNAASRESARVFRNRWSSSPPRAQGITSVETGRRSSSRSITHSFSRCSARRSSSRMSAAIQDSWSSQS